MIKTIKANLLIIGAGRSGTTSLYQHLKQHPDICFSNIKEIAFFSIDEIYKRGEQYYHSFFKCDDKPIIASSDTYLLIDTEAPKKILDYNSDMKFIIMLRDPIERAYSSYIYAINNGHESKTVSFRDAFNQEKEKISNADIIVRNNLGHFYTGLYYKHIKCWMQFFPKENFLFIKTRDLKDNHLEVLKKIQLFLGIGDFIEKKEIKTNEASGVKFMFLHKFLINRNSMLRKISARIFPTFMKELIFNSGIIERIKKLNSKKTSYNTLNSDDRELVSDYFKEDLQFLKDEFGISF